ncbi:MAG TPA: BadF/BadG/BcrA/BcrD ATPase family protein [Gemmatimonadales bacterium]|nr:BadF/BadG/BcrA/BcrD ATPase family protein [Gemmatimonadales bacterium]
MADVIIAADVGGTKTVVAVQVDGTERARVRATGAAVRPGRAMASAATIAAAARQALAEAGQLRGQLLVVGAAGAGREAEAGELARALRAEDVADKVHVTTDIDLAVRAAFGDGAGMVLCAGTGSIAAARAADGTMTRIGGYGWQMGDGGGGYDLGRAALMRVSLGHDGLTAPSALEDRLVGAAHVGDFDGLVRWAAAAGPREVAALARVVLETAAEGDSAAQAVVTYAERQLVELVAALAKRSGVGRVALTGGVLQSGPLRDAVQRALRKAGMEVLDTAVDPIEGAWALSAER